ncbi:MAG: hypothetical protein J6U11_06790 [Campylobacter sp.]|nr:hypothetical protein [Campylobacter sp.]
MSFKVYLLSVFREFFIPRHRSLEFRAKVFVAMLLAKKSQSEEDYAIVNELATEIYQKDKRRIDILNATVREYVKKAKNYKNLNLDSLLIDIDKDLKAHKRYVKKIDFSHLRRLISDDDTDALIQQRVYEFFVSEVKSYS